MNFTQAVKSTTKLAEGLKGGLQALDRKYRKKIQVGDQNQLKGSVYIEGCLRSDYPNDPLWDYVFGYKNKIYYVEVHSANGGGNVPTLIKKRRWFEDWRKKHATALDNLKNSSEFHWINTNRVKLRGRHAHLASQNGLWPKKMLNIP